MRQKVVRVRLNPYLSPYYAKLLQKERSRLISHDNFRFSGEESLTIHPFIEEISNDFTYEFFVKPTAEHHIDYESDHGVAGISGKRYAIGPGGTSDPKKAGVGISVGTNGISVYEHSVNHLPAVLTYKIKLVEEVHVAVTYQQRTPHLYINGQLVRKGIRSKKLNLHPSLIIGGLEPYGFFKGEMKGIRLWDHARTVDEIQSSMNKQDASRVNGLFFQYNRPHETMTFHYKKINSQVSIIIPSHNKFPENTFTLRSLSKQSYDLSKVELIFVDDGSTDATTTTNRLDFNNHLFMIKRIRLTKNKGRPQSRNVGLTYAIGEILIFLDAETIVPLHFIDEHLRVHQRSENTVVSAVMNQKGVYTVFDPAFSKEQKEQVLALMQQANYPEETVEGIMNATLKTPISSYEDIDNATYTTLSFDKPHEAFYEKQLLKPFGKDFKGFHMPWLAFYTGNVSVPRHLLQKSGLFEEHKFVGYGWEDTELGYRLYQVGATFFHHDAIITYHQEHPIHSSVPIDAQKNSYTFFNMYQSDISALILVLYVAGQVGDFKKLNTIVHEYKQLELQEKHLYNSFKYAIKQLLLTLGYLNAYEIPIKHLLRHSQLRSNPEQYRQIIQETRMLKQKGNYPALLEIYDYLSAL